MPANVTTLDREIAREERSVGLPTDQPLTDRAIAHRRFQIAAVMLACGFLALFAVFAAAGILQVCSVALAGGFGIYAIEQDRHLRRLALLRGDSRRITLVVAGELMYSGALASDRELLDLRAGIGRAAGRLASGLADLLPADCTRVRIVGPSGEVPIAAARELVPGHPASADATAAIEAVRQRTPVRKQSGGHTVLAVPLWRRNELLGVLEAVSPADERYEHEDAAVVDAFARGAIAALQGS
jgi:hypothetical protein